jgi:hypothetical protein
LVEGLLTNTGSLLHLGYTHEVNATSMLLNGIHDAKNGITKNIQVSGHRAFPIELESFTYISFRTLLA